MHKARLVVVGIIVWALMVVCTGCTPTVDFVGSYAGTVTITSPADIGSIDLFVRITEQNTNPDNGSLTGQIDAENSLLFFSSEADGDVSIALAGSYDGMAFELDSVSFTLDAEDERNSWGLEVKRKIRLTGNVDAADANALVGVYSEEITGLLPEALIVEGTFKLHRSRD